MIKLIIEKEKQEMLYENFLTENHRKICLKNFVLYLKSFDYPHNEICKLAQISKPTLTEYLTEYKNNGIESFKIKKWKGQPSKLNDYIDIIDKDFEINPPKSINEAQERIEKLTGIKRSPTQIQIFIKKLNYKYLKMGSIPGNGDGNDEKREEIREEFKKKSWNHAWIKQKTENE
jgi:transposase